MNPTCKACRGACCRWLLYPTRDEGTIAFLVATRGIRTLDGVLVRSKCRHLTDDGLCSIQETKPMACRVFQVGCRLCVEARTAQGVKG